MLPPETIAALCPAPVKAGTITLLPVSVAHAAFLDMLGVDIAQGVWIDDALMAAWVLSMPPAEAMAVATAGNGVERFKSWVDGRAEGPEDVWTAVSRQIFAATCTYVPPQDGDNEQTVYAKTRGFGWPLEMADALMHEYGMAFDDVLAMPLARVYALGCCSRIRNGGKNGGPDYYERIDMKKASEEFARIKAERAAKAKQGDLPSADNG